MSSIVKDLLRKDKDIEWLSVFVVVLTGETLTLLILL